MATKTLKPTDHYTIISADTHAGGSHAQYREYLDTAYLDDFDAWRNKYKNPFKDLRDTSERVRNWDSERRWNDEEHDGVVGEVIFPNTVPPFFPSFVLFAAPPIARGLRAPARRDPRPQPLAGRLLRRVPGAARRRRPGLPQRRRRRHRRREVVPRARAARRHPPAERPARRALGQAPLRPVLRPALGGVPGPRDRGGQPRRYRQPRLRVAAGEPTALHHRDRLLLAAAVRAHDPRRRVRALPEAEVHAHRDGCAWIPQVCAQLDQVINSIRSHQVDRRAPLHRRAHPVRRRRPSTSQQNFWVGASQPRPPDAARAHRARAQPVHVGQRLPARRGHVPVHEGAPAPGVLRRRRPRSSSRSSPGTRPSSTTSTSTRSRPRPSGSARPSRRDRRAAHRAARQREPGAAPRDEPDRRRGCARRAGEDVVEPRAGALVPRVGDPARERAEPVGHVGRDEQLDLVAGRRPPRREHQRVVEQVVGAADAHNAGGRFDRSANAGEISGARRSSSVRPGR